MLISTQDTYLHSWGSILVQDVIIPLRGRRLSSRLHLRLLRWSSILVAVFAFIFAAFYKPSEFVQMYFAITGAVISGLGPAIVLGLYWKKGSSLGAWYAVAIGSGLSVIFLVLRQIETHVGVSAEMQMSAVWRAVCYINSWNSQYQWFLIMLTCLFFYVVFSLLSNQESVNMEKMLHRGVYDTSCDHQKAEDSVKNWWARLLAITDEFTFKDRLLAYALVIWNLTWVVLFVVITIWYFLIENLSNEWWKSFWWYWILFQIFVGFGATVWFTVGGIKDIGKVLKRLEQKERNVLDDGFVQDDSEC